MNLDPFPFINNAVVLTDLIWIQTIIVLILLFSSALISGAEVAFFSLQIKSLDNPEETELTTSKKRVLFLLKRPKRLLATILVANNFINIAIVLLFTSLSEAFFHGIENPIILLFIEVGIITTIILIFGEILPKVYANRNALSFSTRMAPFITFLDQFLLFWITYPMSQTSNFLESRLGDKKNQLSVDQLSQALELTGDGETTTDEQRILEGIVNFGSTDTREVMCPRIDMFALSIELSLKEIIPLILEKGFSRIPVYNEKKDNIEGILYIKDLLPHLNKSNYDWQALLKPPIYVPENKKLDDLLKEFQQKKNHLAIVVDEYGGSSGIVTLEDILEEIVGDITDEFDDDDVVFSQLDANTYVFEGKTALMDVYRVLSIDGEEFENEKGEADTIAGFCIEQAGKILLKNERLQFKNYTFVIEAADKRRLKQVKIIIENSEENE